MMTICKLLVFFVLLFSTLTVYSQCETYLQKANTLFVEKNYEEAKRQYANYKECKPNATGINEKIAECDRLLREKSLSDSRNGLGTRTEDDNNSISRNTVSQTNSTDNTQKQQRQPGKIYIGIGSFSGYKNDKAEADATTAFINDGRFIVSKIQNSSWNRNTQEAFVDLDYIISGTGTLIQRENSQTTYIDGGKLLGNTKIPITNTIPEVVNVVLTLTNAKTGQIIFNSTYNLNQIYRISGDIFPVRFTIRKINGKRDKSRRIMAMNNTF